VRIGKRRISKRLVLILVPVVLVLGGSAAAYAADALPFTDISGHWAQQAIVNLAARGIITGHTDGTFGPDQPVTRAQVATFLDRLNTEATKPVVARRGCPDCHAGPYSLKAEAVGAAAGPHSGLADDAGLAACLTCHAPGTGAQAGKGNVAPISLRDIVHPVHMGSKIFAGEFMGNCFTCHNVSGDGTFQVLSLAVDTADDGIPNVLPIPGAVNPQ
jgi:S-layer homology domain